MMNDRKIVQSKYNVNKYFYDHLLQFAVQNLRCCDFGIEETDYYTGSKENSCRIRYFKSIMKGSECGFFTNIKSISHGNYLEKIYITTGTDNPDNVIAILNSINVKFTKPIKKIRHVFSIDNAATEYIFFDEIPKIGYFIKIVVKSTMGKIDIIEEKKKIDTITENYHIGAASIMTESYLDFVILLRHKYESFLNVNPTMTKISNIPPL